MSKIVKFKVSVKEIVEFKMNDKERIELIDFFNSCLSSKSMEKQTKKLLKSMTEVNREFHNNKEVEKALNVLIKNYKKI